MDQSIIMAERLKELREEKGLSFDKLSKELVEKYGIKISPDSLANYEKKNGKNNGMRVEYLRYLSNYYRVSAEYLLGRDVPRTSNTTLRDMAEYTGLSERAIEELNLMNKLWRYDFSTLNSLIMESSFYELIKCLGDFYYASIAKAIYDDIYSRHFPDGDETTGNINKRNLEFTEEINRIIESEKLDPEISNYLSALNQVWDSRSPNYTVGNFMDWGSYVDLTDIIEYRASRQLKTLFDLAKDAAEERRSMYGND